MLSLRWNSFTDIFSIWRRGEIECNVHVHDFGESGLLENEPTAPAEQAHTTQRQ